MLWCSKLSTSSLAFNYQWYILEWNINFRLPLRSVKNIKDKKTKLCLFYLLVHSDFILFFGNLTCLLNPDLKVATEKLCCELFENIISENVSLWGERKRDSKSLFHIIKIQLTVPYIFFQAFSFTLSLVNLRPDSQASLKSC